jgi:hypothetical protein
MSVGMVSSKHGARLSERDVQELDGASNALASAAAAIRRANPSWGEAVVQALILANQVIERLRDRGAATFSRYLEKRGLQQPQEAPVRGDPPGSPMGNCADPDTEPEA